MKKRTSLAVSAFVWSATVVSAWAGGGLSDPFEEVAEEVIAIGARANLPVIPLDKQDIKDIRWLESAALVMRDVMTHIVTFEGDAAAAERFASISQVRFEQWGFFGEPHFRAGLVEWGNTSPQEPGRRELIITLPYSRPEAIPVVREVARAVTKEIKRYYDSRDEIAKQFDQLMQGQVTVEPTRPVMHGR